MNLRQMAGFGTFRSTETPGSSAPTADQYLAVLVEGAAMNMPEIDAQSYQRFRATVGRMAMQVPDLLPNADKLVQIRLILREFENYRISSCNSVQERQAGWRALSSTLLNELLEKLGADANTVLVEPLVQKVGTLTTREDIQAYRKLLKNFLHPGGDDDNDPDKASPLKVADFSTANDNAAGLLGGGSAVEHLKDVMARHGKAFIVLFGLSCLNVISERFGMEAVEDCLMSVSAFLTNNLRSDDVIYHWSDSSLLAIVEGRASEQILAAELDRIAARNREITIQIGGRKVMLRVPLDYHITPVSSLSTAEDLYKLSMEHAAQW